jgi:hypothetical protein
MRRLRIAQMVAAWTFAALCSSNADAAEPSFHVRFTEGSECADLPAAISELRARALTVVPGDAPGSTELSITVTHDNYVYDAHMVIREVGQPPLRRDVTAGSCTDVLRTFAFTLALAADSTPRARTPSTLTPPPPSSATPVPPTTPAETPAAPTPDHVQFGVHAAVGVAVGAAPLALAVMGGDAELAFVRPGRVLSPLVRLGGFAAVPATTQQPVFNTRYGMQSGRLDACPVELFDVVRPCARLELGRLQMKEFGVPGATLQDEVWASTQLVLMLRWSPVAPLFFEAAGAFGVALSRPTLTYGGQDLFTVPLLVGGGEIAVGVHFP